MIARLGGALTLSLACAAAVPPAAEVTPAPAADTTWVRRVEGVAVLDSAGQPYRFPFFGGLDRPRPQLADIDGDGDLDLFVQEYTGWVAFFERDDSAGTMRYVWRTDRYADLPVGEWNRLLDVDGDGDIDMLAEEPYSMIRYYRNDGSPRAARWTLASDTLKDAAGEPIFADRQNIPQLADIDCNGRLDLMLGRVDGTITRFEMQPGTAGSDPAFRFVTNGFEGILIVGQQFGSMHGANTMSISDIDADGDPDILWGDFFEAGVLWIVNAGTCQAPAMGGTPVQFPPSNPVTTSGYNATAVADIDGDEDLDVLLGALGGAFNPSATARENLYLLEQRAPGQWTVATRRFLSMFDVGSESVPTFVDLDADGDLDLVVGNKLDAGAGTGSLTLLVNEGSARAPRYRERGTIAVGENYQLAPAFGDLDGDGDPDLVLGSWQDEVQYYRNEGGAFALADSAIVKLTRGSHAAPTLGDLDGDGDLDLVIGEASGAINVYRNTGSARAPAFELVTDDAEGIEAGRRSVPYLVDMDGDGRLELLVGEETGAVTRYRAMGGDGMRWERDAAFRLEVTPLAAPAAADLDGDGDVDVLAGGASGGVVWMERR